MTQSHHMSSEEFRSRGRQVIDWIADYMQEIESLPVRSRVKPGEVRSQLPQSPPLNSESLDAVLADLARVIVPGLMHWQSPSFFGYFPANASGPSILGELLSAGLGVQGMLWATSPACTELEMLMLDWLVEMLALPPKFRSDVAKGRGRGDGGRSDRVGGGGGGVIQDTASSASLCALLAARERATQFQSNQLGLQQGLHQPLVAYTSSQAHSSIEKGMMIAGLGRENLRVIAAPAACGFAMDPDDLARRMRADLDQGKIPCFVCATVGTTSSNAIDPVPRIAQIIKDIAPKTWLHVDAAMSGTAALCPEFRFIHDGLEFADSYCFNPHKWMFTNFDCNCFWVADRTELINTLSVLPEYLKNAATESGAVIDYRDWQIPLGRRFRALKLWFVIRHYGVEGLRHHVREHVRLAQEFASWVRADQRFELVVEPPLNLVCFRLNASDDANQRLLNSLNESGKLYLTHTKLDGRFVLRMSIGGTHTQRKHVERAWQRIREAASGL